VTAINKTLRFGPGESYEGLAILGWAAGDRRGSQGPER
jgi:hypothetical protein